MRDPQRIGKFCNRLAAAWAAVPDMRFGQLMVNVFRIMVADNRDPFFPEEDEMIRRIEQFCQEFTGRETRAVTPRIMALEEVVKTEGAVWLEFKDEEGLYTYYAYAFFGGMYSDGEIVVMIVKNENPLFSFIAAEYGKRWRCWTLKPTIEQMDTVNMLDS